MRIFDRPHTVTMSQSGSDNFMYSIWTLREKYDGFTMSITVSDWGFSRCYRYGFCKSYKIHNMLI